MQRQLLFLLRQHGCSLMLTLSLNFTNEHPTSKMDHKDTIRCLGRPFSTNGTSVRVCRRVRSWTWLERLTTTLYIFNRKVSSFRSFLLPFSTQTSIDQHSVICRGVVESAGKPLTLYLERKKFYRIWKSELAAACKHFCARQRFYRARSGR
jgi:hypothetical protein